MGLNDEIDLQKLDEFSNRIMDIADELEISDREMLLILADLQAMTINALRSRLKNFLEDA